jgi:putative addiction module component (TIGR02574 family)
MSDYDTLLANASQWPLDVRVQLIEALWDTLPEDAIPPLNGEWLAEIQRRSAEYDAGLVQPVAWEEVRSESLRRQKEGK